MWKYKASGFSKRQGLAACLSAAVFLLLAFDVRLKTVVYTWESKKIKEPFRIALITDLHSCYYGKGQKTLTDALDKGNPDIILLGGDIFDDIIENDNTEIFLNHIKEGAPAFYVSGNHEHKNKEYSTEELLDIVRSYGIEVLDGRHKELVIKGNRISVCGVCDPVSNRYEERFHRQLREVASTIDSEVLTMLLTHRPEYIEKYLSYGFDLSLAGHAHGGQWRVPLLLNGLLAPNQGFFPKYAGGKYVFGDKAMVVSRGLARESTRIPRIFNRPELVFIDIVPKQ